MSPNGTERRVNPAQARLRPPRNTHDKLATLIIFVIAAVAVTQVQHQRQVLTAPFAAFLPSRPLPQARPSMNAFGASGEVKVRFALPGEPIEYPLEIQGDPSELKYSWVRVGDAVPVSPAAPLAGPVLTVPRRPGFYRVAILRGGQQRVVDGLAVAVLAPFEQKVGGILNGYRIGTYVSERVAGKRPPPEGFMEITPRDLDLHITKHLKVSDFLSHDSQKSWPRYAAVSPRLLDKLELVVGEIQRWHGKGPLDLALDVRSGFRSPDHNSRIRRAARDSRHQYGDAADVTIDANGDGKFSEMDTRLVGLAVEIVEMKHPELAGGLGMYLRGRSPYVHIDARGKKARWRG